MVNIDKYILHKLEGCAILISRRREHMEGMTIEKAAAACGGRLSTSEGGQTPLGKIVIDSRAVEPGDLFVAYKGERADGHD